MGSISGSGRSPGGEHGNPLQYFFVLAIGCGMWELDSPTRDQTRAPIVKARNLNPCTAREVPHSSILAWRIPWTEEPGRVQSRGSQRIGHV